MRKAISLMLVFVLLSAQLLALAPAAPAYATSPLPRTFDKSRVIGLNSYLATLNIGQMTFQGKMTNADLSDEKLYEFIQKVFKDMNMIEEEFDVLNEMIILMDSYNTITPEQAKVIYDRWGAMFKAATGPLGAAASKIQSLVSLLSFLSDFAAGKVTLSLGEGAKNAADSLVDKLWDSVVDGYLGKGTAEAVGKASTIAKGAIAMMEGMVESHGYVKDKINAKAAGMEAYRTINSFYAALNREITGYYNSVHPVFMLEFVNAKCERNFTLFGRVYTETWTLNMTLFSETRDATYNINGRYGGDYVIDIEYDLANLPHSIREMGDVGQRWAVHVEGEAFEGKQFVVTSIDSPDSFGRMLEGKAVAYLEAIGRSTITPAQERDRKNMAGSVISASYFNSNTHAGARYTIDYDIFFALGDESINIANTRNYVTVTGPDFHMAREGPVGAADVPLDGTIYQRGDAAKSNWSITLTPVGR